jgi:hypothetical protein
MEALKKIIVDFVNCSAIFKLKWHRIGRKMGPAPRQKKENITPVATPNLPIEPLDSKMKSSDADSAIVKGEIANEDDIGSCTSMNNVIAHAISVPVDMRIDQESVRHRWDNMPLNVQSLVWEMHHRSNVGQAEWRFDRQKAKSIQDAVPGLAALVIPLHNNPNAAIETSLVHIPTFLHCLGLPFYRHPTRVEAIASQQQRLRPDSPRQLLDLLSSFLAKLPEAPALQFAHR